MRGMKLFFIILLLVVYILSPWDLIPDFLFGPGWLDDLSLIGLLSYYYFYRKQKEAGTGEGPRQTRRQSTREEPPHSPRNPYDVLGISRSATPEEIRAAYRRLANQYHPDKVSHLGEEFRVLAEQRFKEIQRAYQELSNGRS